MFKANPNIILDKIHLHIDQQHSTQSLESFFLSCGQRINALILECQPQTYLTFNDLYCIAQYCPLLDSLQINNLQFHSGKEAHSLFTYFKTVLI